MAINLACIVIVSLVLDSLLRRLRLPGLLGMLLVGIVAGLVTAGLFSNQLVGSMEIKTALWVGLGVGIVLALLFTYVFDKVSKLMGRVSRAAEQSSENLASAGKQLGKRVGSILRKRR